MNRIFLITLLSLLTACGTSPSVSRPSKIITQGDWRVSVMEEGKPDMLCYAGTSPTKSGGTTGPREGRPFLMFTRRPSGKIEVSASAGYAFMRGSKVELAVDDDTYSLFYKDKVAWARSDEDDKDIIEAMESADDIEMRGLSQAGLTSVDYYTPHGFAAAIARIRELCP